MECALAVLDGPFEPTFPFFFLCMLAFFLWPVNFHKTEPREGSVLDLNVVPISLSVL
jgi:hypothetical protein